MRLAAAGWLLCGAAMASAQDDPTHADWNGVWFTEQGANTQISGFLSQEDVRRGNQLPLLDRNAPWTPEARALLEDQGNSFDGYGESDVINNDDYVN